MNKTFLQIHSSTLASLNLRCETLNKNKMTKYVTMLRKCYYQASKINQFKGIFVIYKLSLKAISPPLTPEKCQ